MDKRSNLMVILGAAFFIIGGLIVFLVLKDSDDGGSAVQPGETTIVVATDDLAAGSLGTDLIANELITTKTVPFGSQPDAVTTISQLSGATLVNAVGNGGVITFSNITRDQIRNIEIPAGFDGVAVEFDFLSGGAGYVDPGDRLNIYGVDAECKPFTVVDGSEVRENCPHSTPRVELILTNALVLDVDLQIAANRGTGATGNATTPDVTTIEGNVIRRPSADKVTYLLALTPADAEKVIHQVEFERMYVSIVAIDAPPAGPTGGQDFTTIFTEEPNAAFDRSNPDG